MLGCLLLAGVVAGCGGGTSPEPAVAPVEVEDSNTAQGRFPEDELVRAQDEAAAEAAAAAAAAEAEAAAAAEAAAEVPAEVPVEAAEPEPAQEAPAPADPPAPEPATEPSGVPAGGLPAGSYTTTTFEPQFSLEVDEGWVSFQTELPDFVAISPADDLDLTISFLSPKLATALIDELGEYTTELPPEGELLDPAVFNYFDWLHEHPSYTAGEIRSELLAGRVVASFDATLTSGYAWNQCFVDCVLIMATSDGELLAQEVGYRERLYTTEVGDLTFVVSIAAPEQKFDAFVRRAVGLLSTLQLTADLEPAPEDDAPATEEPAPVEPAPEDPAPPPAPTPRALPTEARSPAARARTCRAARRRRRARSPAARARTCRAARRRRRARSPAARAARVVDLDGWFHDYARQPQTHAIVERTI